MRAWIILTVVCGGIGLLKSSSTAAAGEYYISVPVEQLPGYSKQKFKNSQVSVQLTSPGEAFVISDLSQSQNPGVDMFPGTAFNQRVIIRSSSRMVKGFIYTSTSALFRAESIPDRAPFQLKLPARNTAQVQKDFWAAKAQTYQALARTNGAGSALFAQIARDATLKSGKKSYASANDWRRRRKKMLDLFDGKEAIMENLSLDKKIIIDSLNEKQVIPITSLQGITIKEYDWKARLGKKKPAIDPLASLVPHDQYGIFFNSFVGMLNTFYYLDQYGTPISNTIEENTEDNSTRTKYREQLGLTNSRFTKWIGKMTIDSVAITGTDPFFRQGSDMGLLFATKSEGIVFRGITRQQQAALKKAGAKFNKDKKAGLAGGCTLDRSVCTWSARVGGAVAVANSRKLLKRIISAKARKTTSLAQLAEYRYFRTLYPRAEDNGGAYLFISDATIRRWSSPSWRLAAARRELAAGLLADLQLNYGSQLVNKKLRKGRIPNNPYPALGTLYLTDAGIHSSVYGNLGFLTPISEIGITKVSKREAELYTEWRKQYEQGWPFFDPIGVRIQANKAGLDVDLTVMPLKMNSQYAQFMNFIAGAEISKNYDPASAKTVLNAVVAINWDDPMLKTYMAAGSQGRPHLLDWMGPTIEFFAMEDPIWEKYVNDPNAAEKHLRKMGRIPLGLQMEVKNKKSFQEFMGYSIAMLYKKTKMTETKKSYKKREYFSIDLPKDKVPVGIHYWLRDDSVIFALDEQVIKTLIDEQTGKGKNSPRRKDLRKFMTNKNAAVLMSGVISKYEKNRPDTNYSRNLAQSCWSSIPVLNELKKRFPKVDPAVAYERLWHKKISCNGKGYRWDSYLNSMTSIDFGHPMMPKYKQVTPPLYQNLSEMGLGINLMADGLRAHTLIKRKPAH